MWLRPQYAELNFSRNIDPRFVRIHDWIPGKGIFRDDLKMFNWLLENLSENDRTLFGKFKSGENPAESLHTRFKSLIVALWNWQMISPMAYMI